MTTNNENQYTLGGKHKFRVVKEETGEEYALYEDGHKCPVIETENFGKCVLLDFNERNSYNLSFVGRFTDAYKTILEGDAHFILCNELENYNGTQIFQRVSEGQEIFYSFFPVMVFYCLDETLGKSFKETCMRLVNVESLETIKPRYAITMYSDSEDTFSKLYYISKCFSIMLDKNDGDVASFETTEMAKTAIHATARHIISISESLKKLYEEYPSELPQNAGMTVSHALKCKGEAKEVDNDFYKKLDDILTSCEKEGIYEYPFIYAQAEGRLKYFVDNPNCTDKEWYKAFCNQFEIVELPYLNEEGHVVLHKIPK